MALFADYILIYLLSPNAPLPALMPTLTDYGHLSAYRIYIYKKLRLLPLIIVQAKRLGISTRSTELKSNKIFRS